MATPAGQWQEQRQDQEQQQHKQQEQSSLGFPGLPWASLGALITKSLPSIILRSRRRSKRSSKGSTRKRSKRISKKEKCGIRKLQSSSVGGMPMKFEITLVCFWNMSGCLQMSELCKKVQDVLDLQFLQLSSNCRKRLQAKNPS